MCLDMNRNVIIPEVGIYQYVTNLIEVANTRLLLLLDSNKHN